MSERLKDAALGFESNAAAYERARPSYPAEVVAHVVGHGAIGPGRRVIDLAAGTGKLTRLLVPTGAEVVAVEPVAGMRAQLAAALPGIDVLDGTAEALPLPDDSADAVTVAQAFHWFDGDGALAEIYRVLRPGGRLALVWNRRVEHSPLNAAIDELVEPYRQGTPTHRGEVWRAAFDRTTLFGPLEEHVFANEQVLDADRLAARICSISFIACLPELERVRVLVRARELAADGPVTVPYRTEVLVCERLDVTAGS
jgi:SAM-dependent methyltransferase